MELSSTNHSLVVLVVEGKVSGLREAIVAGASISCRKKPDFSVAKPVQVSPIGVGVSWVLGLVLRGSDTRVTDPGKNGRRGLVLYGSEPEYLDPVGGRNDGGF